MATLVRTVTQVFLLSPAFCGGRRARVLLRADAQNGLARRLRAGEMTLGEAFSFLSGLYFRGKITYASRFAGSPESTLIITPTRGLQPPDLLVSPELLNEFAAVDIAEDDPRYREPLERDVRRLAARLPVDARAVLLGSVASGKYVNILVDLLGGRLHFPPSFIGRGDMSRGGLLLRHAASGSELEYQRLELTSPRRGPRPPKLEPIRKRC